MNYRKFLIAALLVMSFAVQAKDITVTRLTCEMRDEKYDGMIITGAPVEQMPYEDVNYWDEITTIFDWARTHVCLLYTSSLRMQPKVESFC